MTTGIQCRADPQCQIPAPAETGICHCHTKPVTKAGATIGKPSRAGHARTASTREPEQELEQ